MTTLQFTALSRSRIVVMCLGLAIGTGVAEAQETARVAIPPAINFSISNVNQSTAGTPATSTVNLTQITLNTGKALRVSVKADTAAFTPPSSGGTTIPVSKVSWSITGATRGVGTGGTLSSASYGLVYQSNVAVTSGNVQLAWALAAPGGGLRPGDHRLTIRWKLESITP
jgi:hypothetical protein